MVPRLFDPEAAPPGRSAPHSVGQVTVGHVIREYLAAKAARVATGRIGAGALYRARLYCEAFAEHFDQVPISQCRQGDLHRFLDLRPEYRAPATMHDACGAVVTAFKWAVRDGLIDDSPYVRPDDLPSPEPRGPAWSPEVRTLLDYAWTHGRRKTRRNFCIALYFLWRSGARTCEVYDVCWEHWDDDRAVFELPSKTTRKTGRQRLIVPEPRGVHLVRYLRRRILAAGKPLTGPVFLNGRGRKWTKDTFGKLFRKHADGAGIREEVTAYCLRHGFACELLEAGAEERQIADLMGHSTTRQIGWYGRGVKRRLEYLRKTAGMRGRKKG